MSLSQKHPGLAVIPWYNKEEWISVYNLVYSEEIENLKLGLQHLKAWKNKFSSLPSGIEGTLDILQAHIASLEQSNPSILLKDDICVRLIYSLTVVRFLNAFITNQKNTNFSKSARKINIHQSIIDMRHNVAHNNELPSRFELRRALISCLCWLIGDSKKNGKPFVNEVWFSLLVSDMCEENLQCAMQHLEDSLANGDEVAAEVCSIYEILKVLLSDYYKEQCIYEYFFVKMICSLALVRFLNICVNNDKQGTFTKTTREHGIPNWLIKMRHNIMHNNILPPLTELNAGIEFSLSWLKEKYWDEQNCITEDLIIIGKTADENLANYLYVYVFYVLNEYLRKTYDEFDDDLKAAIHTLPKSIRKVKRESTTVKKFIWETLTSKPCTSSFPIAVECILTPFVNKVLFLKDIETLKDGSVSIVRQYRDLWSDFFNLLLKQKSLFIIIYALFKVTIGYTHFDSIKLRSALWIKEIFNSLINLRNRKRNIKGESEYKNSMILDSDELPYEEAQYFQKEILKSPNKFTCIYSNSVMHFNNETKEFEEVSKSLLSISKPNYNKIYDITDVEHIFKIENIYDELYKAIEINKELENSYKDKARGRSFC